jgi:hypothetical protein
VTVNGTEHQDDGEPHKNYSTADVDIHLYISKKDSRRKKLITDKASMRMRPAHLAWNVAAKDSIRVWCVSRNELKQENTRSCSLTIDGQVTLRCGDVIDRVIIRACCEPEDPEDTQLDQLERYKPKGIAREHLNRQPVREHQYYPSYLGGFGIGNAYANGMKRILSTAEAIGRP